MKRGRAYWCVVLAYYTPTSAERVEAWAQVLQRGYEGMVGKDDASP
jgi:hypothetical protein